MSYIYFIVLVLIPLFTFMLYRQYLLNQKNRLLHGAYVRINRQQKEIKEQKMIYERVFNHNKDAAIIFHENKITSCNQTTVEMLGYKSKEEIYQLHFSDFSPLYQPNGEASDIKYAQMIALAFQNGSHRFEWVHTKASGENFWVEVSIIPITLDNKNVIHAIWRDISKPKALEQENILLNFTLESKIQKALSSLKKAQAQIGSWEYHITTDSLIWSEETYHIFEFYPTVQKPSNDHYEIRVHPEDKEKAKKRYIQSLKDKQPYSITHRLLMPDGRIKYVKEHCESTFDSKGKALLSVGTIQDITVEQTALEEIRYKDDLLFRQSRLAQMGEMISMIAHQWRQPLNAISLTTATLEMKLEKETYNKTFFYSRLKRISYYVQHLSATIEDFRNFFKPDKEKVETTFPEIIKNTLILIRTEIESQLIEIEVEHQDHSKIFSYPNELLQVILNLIKNAEDALIEKRIEKPVIKIKSYSHQDKAILEISDNAQGINPEIIDKIFNPYFTTKNEHQGTGLGLYMSKIIIEDHCHGTLEVSNREEGAMFTITLNKGV